MKNIIAINAKQGGGKSTLAEGLKQDLIYMGKNCEIFKFAGILYEMHDLILPVLKRVGVRPKDMTKDGDLLQVLGTEYGRKCIDENVWVHALRARVDKYVHLSPMNVAIVDDMRFENEFDGLEDALKIRLEASAEVRRTRVSYWRENENHPSEIGLDSYFEQGLFDFVVNTETHDKEFTRQVCLDKWRESL